MTPQRFERFTITRKLPAGGMGRVYEATDTSNGRRVALKLIDTGTDSDSMQIVAAERLGVELHKRLYALDPRITAVYDSGETSEYLYIVMEYIDGQDLSELSARERIGFPFAARIAQDVLEVLSIAHNFGTMIEGREYRGIVHGDIKPRNIRLTTVGQVKVLDFGIAKALSATRSFTQNVFGSVQYSSPERLSTGEVTISSDLWAVGVVLFEMIARRPYFPSESGPKLECLIRDYRELQPLPEDCPESLKQILRRALAPDPERRYESADEFAGDLSAFRHDRLPAAAAFDHESTRRTAREAEGETRRTVATVESDTGPGDAGATRRTARGTNGQGLSAGAPVAPVPPAAPLKVAAARRPGPRWGRIALVICLGFFAWLSYFVVHEFHVWQDAGTLARDIETERSQKLDDVWERYQGLASRANLGWSLWRAQDALRYRMLADADRVIAQFRNQDSPPEADWVRARASAVHALELKPQDKLIHSKLRIIDGQLNRIRGSNRRDGKMLQQARENFDEASQLDPKSPDPWLGLARLAVYSLHDVDSAETALKEAEKRHHDVGKRETAELADGYRDRAERTMREAQNALNRPEEDRYIELASKDFERARDLYESIVPWGGAAASLRKTYDEMQKLDELRSVPEEHEDHKPTTPKVRWWQKLPGIR